MSNLDIDGISVYCRIIIKDHGVRCSSCGVYDMPCISPFVTYLFPNEVFCSASCALRKYDILHSHSHMAVITKVSMLTSECKNELFGNICANSSTDTREARLISQIKALDEDLSREFSKRTPIVEGVTVKMASLAFELQTADTVEPHESGTVHQIHAINSGKVYKRLGAISSQFRDMKPLGGTDLCCDQLITSSFIAVSYCWPSQDWKRVASLSNKNPLPRRLVAPISQNMLDAIALLRRHDIEPIWVDQLCINQESSEERAMSIASMDTLYERARLVVIVLEDVEITQNELKVWRRLRHNAAIARKIGRQIPMDAAALGTITQIVVKVLSAHWHTRAWCLQEYLVSRKCVFLVPSSGHIVLISPKILQHTLDYRCGIPSILGSSPYNVAQCLKYRYSTSSGHRSIPDILAYVSMRQSSYLADKMSIVLNAYGTGLRYSGNSINEEEFCYKCIVLALAVRDMTVLCNAGPQLFLGNTSFRSWAFRPSSNRVLERNPVTRPKGPSSLILVKPDRIVINILLLDGECNTPTVSSLDKSSKIFESAEMAMLINSLTLGTSTTVKHFIRSFAIALECGLEWMLAVSKLIWANIQLGRIARRDKVVQENWHIATKFWEILQESEDPESMAKWTREDLEECALKFVILLLSFDFPFHSIMPIVGSHAVYSVVPPGAKAALPVDLLGTEYISQHRLWFLKPIGQNQWKILGKGLIFCPIPLKEEATILLKTKQCVRG
jgi:heterokaryon incompatibility protein (HET)